MTTLVLLPDATPYRVVASLVIHFSFYHQPANRQSSTGLIPILTVVKPNSLRGRGSQSGYWRSSWVYGRKAKGDFWRIKRSSLRFSNSAIFEKVLHLRSMFLNSSQPSLNAWKVSSKNHVHVKLKKGIGDQCSIDRKEGRKQLFTSHIYICRVGSTVPAIDTDGDTGQDRISSGIDVSLKPEREHDQKDAANCISCRKMMRCDVMWCSTWEAMSSPWTKHNEFDFTVEVENASWL